MIDNVIHVFMDWKIIKDFSARASHVEHLRDFQNVISRHDHVCDLKWVLDWEGWLEMWNLLLQTYVRNDEILHTIEVRINRRGMKQREFPGLGGFPIM